MIPEAEAEKNVSLRNGSPGKTALIVLIIIVITGAIAGYRYWMDLRTYVSTDNAKVAGDLVDISSKVSGRLEKILVKEEQHVKKGQVLARVEQTPYRIALDQAAANLALARANYAKLPDDLKSAASARDKAEEALAAAQAQAKSAEVTMADARRNFYQVENLYENGAVSREAYDSARSKVEMAQTALTAAQANVDAARAALIDATAKLEATRNTAKNIYEAQVKQAQAAFNSAKYTYENCVIKAPCDGTVIRINVQEGENISSGQAIMVIANLDSTWIAANIDEGKVGRIKVGQPVQISIDAYPGRKLKGHVAAIGGATQSMFALIPTENTSGNYTKVVQRIPIKITVDSKELVLKPGMSAVVKIRTRE